jgi:hypothetical protein
LSTLSFLDGGAFVRGAFVCIPNVTSPSPDQINGLHYFAIQSLHNLKFSLQLINGFVHWLKDGKV